MNQNNPPSGYKHLTDIQVDRCLSLDHAGWSLRGIANEIGCSHTTVKRVLNEYDYDTFQTCKKHLGPARKTTEADDRLLIRITKKHYDLPFCNIINIAKLPISSKTVVHCCKEVQLISRYAHCKLFLTTKHKKDRLKSTKRYQNYTYEDWCKVIWSDECLMRIGLDSAYRHMLQEDGST